jgi:pyruvate dehydrogenase E2 component (dihydrolipoamide acetyltransferase)
MATNIIMPKLGLTMQEGKIIKWLKKEGDPVEPGNILYELETEKITFQVEANASGILGKIVVPEGETVQVGTVVGYIIQPGEKLDEGVQAKVTRAEVLVVEVSSKGTSLEMPAQQDEGVAVKASPLAKRIAQEKGLDISNIVGTGPGGRITREDVENAAKRVTAAVPVAGISAENGKTEDKLVPLTGMRATIGRRMSQAFREIPHFWQTVEADTTELSKARSQLIPMIEKETGQRLSLSDLMVKAVARSLRENPDVNANFTEKGILLRADVNVGIAVSVKGGLIVPVIRHADRRNLVDFVRCRAELVNKARDGKLLPDDITGGTFTFTNLGMFGIDSGDSIINPPEVAILFVGRIIEKPAVVNKEIVPKPMISMTLGIDHRALDGVIGARFLTRVKEFIENPFVLFWDT